LQVNFRFIFMPQMKRLLSVKLFIIGLCFFILLMPQQGWAQNAFEVETLKTLKSEEIADDDIAKFYKRILQEGLSLEQFAERARRQGANPQEVSKVLARLQKYEDASNENFESESEKEVEENAKKQTSFKLIPEEERIFGMELFESSNFSFEPNLRIPTPSNYLIGAGDELLIDVFGYSEQTFNPKVSPDGKIRIPNIGLISVAGLTIEQASSKIKRSLSNVYSGVSTGQTQVSVTLGNIRSIRVMVTGEVSKPGSYTIPSLASVFNVLYAAGGPSKNGSFRNIVVVRNNKIISKLDVYEFLKTGISKNNIHLQDNDVVKVFPYQTRVQLIGEVKRQGYFEAKEKETLNDLFEIAGGFTSKAYQARVKVTRNTSSQKSVADVPNELYKMFTLNNGDIFKIDSLLDRYENRVKIEGAVFRPGDFKLQPNLTVGKLIQKADGLKEDAFGTRGVIYRLKADNMLEMLSFNPAEVLTGASKDIPLKREDKVLIAYKSESKEGRKVVVNGEVLYPGVYDYADNMTIADLIVAAGGFKESASLKRVEVSRRKFDVDRKSNTSEISIIKQFNLERELKNSGDAEFTLASFDMVSVFRNEGLVAQKTIKVEGEVLFPGSYVVSKSKETITDIILRSGGLTGNGYPEGAMLLRKKQMNGTDNIIALNKKRVLKQQSKDSLTSKKLDETEKESPYDIVGIDLDELLKKPGSPEDLLVRDGDILIIPDAKQTVLVSGEVLYPVRIRFQKRNSLKDYVSEAGGFSARALKRKSYVVYPNGRAKATKAFLGLKFYPKIIAGSEVVVPQKAEKRQVSAIEYATIITSLTSLLLLTYTLIQPTP